jgi:NADPH-dependent glutamate synthase beta subunit-like oxidoreductase/coenzyme F420-reducing hydrogenase delta subunit/formate hydrogenlyase subunit 6/NADH:ubiquinone oxidoreductase subunit I
LRSDVAHMSQRYPQPSAVVVGSGPAEAQAALDLAQAGVKVTLMTAEDWLMPGSHGPAGMLPLLEATLHPRIDLLTGASVERVAHVEGASNSSALAITIHQSPRYVDVARCTACGACAQVCPVLLPGVVPLAGQPSTTPDERSLWTEFGEEPAQASTHHHTAIHRGGVPTVFSIDKAGTAPCRNACPIDQRAQGYIALIGVKNFEAAFRTIKSENPFPSVCGRVCNHRCEETCTRCEVDQPVAVMALKRFVADWAYEAGVQGTADIAPSSGYRVAVVGSGPAGLTAAREMNRLGHKVTVLEALPVPGGMMQVGIPAFRLPRERLSEEIDQILCEGVELRTSTRVKDVERLFTDGYDAVVLALGLHVSRRVAIPGAQESGSADLECTQTERGLMGAVEFLRQVNLGERPDLAGQQVVVIGGGSTAVDTARVCRRLGADVTILYRRSRAEMPAHDLEVHAAQREGVAIRYLVNPARVLRQDGRVAALECLQMELGEPDDSGRRRPIAVAGSEFTVPADIVLLAVGQTSDVSCLSSGDVALNRSGVLTHDPQTLMTSRRGLFVAGDVAGAGGFVVDAIASGAKAARAVDRYLRGPQAVSEPVKQPVVQLDAAQVTQHLATSAPKGTARPEGRSVFPETLLGDFTETESGLTEQEAVDEALRCLGCGDCSECLACVEVCPANAIDHEAQARVMELRTGALVWAGGRQASGHEAPGSPVPGVFFAADGTNVGDAVNSALLHLDVPRRSPTPRIAAPSRLQSMRDGAHGAVLGSRVGSRHQDVGIFLCRCGGEIERVLDLHTVAARVERIAGVTHVDTVDFACHPEGAAALQATLTTKRLDAAILAACSCCALDQICYGCTTQRTRCKERLGVWDDLGGIPLRFVNVREQCAFVHADDPVAATAKAGDLVAASVAALLIENGGWATAIGLGSVPHAQIPRGRSPIPIFSSQDSADASRVPITALVDPVRCRGCEDCESACGLEAIKVVHISAGSMAQVDAARCLGCGICIGACSSGAIWAGDTSDAQAEAMLAAMGGLTGKTVVFSCNWGAFSALEAAGVERLSYAPSVRVVRLMCAGRVHTGLILRAFAQGAAGVLVLACGHAGTETQCHYQTGSAAAASAVERAHNILTLLGIDLRRLALAEMQPGDGAAFAEVVESFTATA